MKSHVQEFNTKPEDLRSTGSYKQAVKIQLSFGEKFPVSVKKSGVQTVSSLQPKSQVSPQCAREGSGPYFTDNRLLARTTAVLVLSRYESDLVSEINPIELIESDHRLARFSFDK